MLKSMLTKIFKHCIGLAGSTKIVKHCIWLADSTAASQSDATLENHHNSLCHPLIPGTNQVPYTVLEDCTGAPVYELSNPGFLSTGRVVIMQESAECRTYSLEIEILTSKGTATSHEDLTQYLMDWQIDWPIDWLILFVKIVDASTLTI